MRYLQQHISDIIATYNGSLPLAHFLKNHFRKHPKLGSRDRKMLSAITYNWYRISKGITNVEYLNNIITQWLNDKDKLLKGSIAQWLNDASAPFDTDRLFPYDTTLSSGITRSEWLTSMLAQPDLFIRIRKDRDKIVSLLNEQQISFSFITDNCLSLPNGAKIDTLLPADSYAVQDASSQQTGTFFKPQKNEQWYDCCSGAGGKSLLLKDIEPGVHLSVSDIRESILHNLKERFRLYHMQMPDAYVVNTANKEQLATKLGNKQFDNIICDVPCSGSGTWARTPEQLYFFDPNSFAKFPPLQKAIATNVSNYIKPGGKLFYITCSVFQQENEDVVNHITKETGLKLVHSQIINGVHIHADSMFIAVLQREKI